VCYKPGHTAETHHCPVCKTIHNYTIMVTTTIRGGDVKTVLMPYTVFYDRVPTKNRRYAESVLEMQTRMPDNAERFICYKTICGNIDELDFRVVEN
jgi:hypothetical protein